MLCIMGPLKSALFPLSFDADVAEREMEGVLFKLNEMETRKRLFPLK